MSDFVNVLKRVNKQISINAYSYVYYNELSGEILKISNTDISSDHPMIRVNHNQVKDIIRGRYKYNEYLVTYDNVQKTNILKRRDFKNNTYEVKDRLYKIKEIYDDYYHREIYKGVYVDVWYKELEHLSGQHVWFRDSVFRATKDLPANIDFSLSDYEKILDNVILYADANINLDFGVIDKVGQTYLSYNQLYQYQKGTGTDDFVIERRIEDKSWHFKTSLTIKDNVSFRVSEKMKETILSVFATEMNDPNILYRNFALPVNELLDKGQILVPFKYDWESSNKQVSMYTSKFFDTYSYRII